MRMNDIKKKLNEQKVEVLRLERLNGEKCMVEIALKDKEKEMGLLQADISLLKSEKDQNKD